MISLKNSEQVSAAGTLVIAALFAFLSFYNTDAENFLFPRIIAVVLALLSVILFISNSASNGDTATSSGERYFSYIWHGLIIGLIYFVIIEDLGFYASSFLAFLAILLIYGNRPVADLKALATKVMVSAGFMFVLYLLFWNGLNVRTPTGLIF